MKTIEDKINGIVEGHAECRWLDACELRKYLEEVATEQKEIDDRRYEFFKEKLINWCAAWMNDNPRGTMSAKEWIDTLHKAMEE